MKVYDYLYTYYKTVYSFTGTEEQWETFLESERGKMYDLVSKTEVPELKQKEKEKSEA